LKYVVYFHEVGTGTDGAGRNIAVRRRCPTRRWLVPVVRPQARISKKKEAPMQFIHQTNAALYFGTCSYLILPLSNNCPLGSPRAYWHAIGRP
jgi:hypothetical protein